MSNQPNVVLRGNIKAINLGTSSFQKIIANNDKTAFIEHFLDEPNDVQLIVRQRRLGKSLNLNTLQCFLTDKVDNRALFQGLYIEQSPQFVQCNSAPAFYFDFKNLNLIDYKRQVSAQIYKQIVSYVAIEQINLKRYTAELNPHKPIIKTAIAFCGKYCLVESELHR